MASTGVVVWEWQNEFGCWQPYDPTISTFIESNKTSANPLKLGHVDPSLYLYEIDLQKMCQTRLGTGTHRLIRRQVQPPTSPLAKGITWQWEGDIPGRWNDFDVDVIEHLEDCFSQGQTFIDLTVMPTHLPYHIDLSNMTQTRVHTGRVRKIQRVFTSSSYPLDLSASTGTSNSSKRAMASSNDVLIKKPRTISSSMNTASAATSTSSSSGLSLTIPTFSTSALFGQQSSLMHQSALANNSTSVPSSVIQFGQGQGPLTRSRYNSGLAAMMMQNPPYQVFQPSQAPPPSTASNNNNYLSNLNLPGTGLSFSNTNFSNTSGYMHGLFSNQTSVPSQGGYGGVTPQHVSNSYVGFTPSSTATFQQNLSYPPSGGLNPSGVFGGSRSGRVRPSASSRSSRSSQQNHGRIPNFDKSAKQRNTNVNSSSDIINSYAVLLNTSPADEDCCICFEKLQEASGHGTGTVEDHAVIQLEKCSHMFHKLCLKAMYESGPQEGSLQCPTCKTFYGEKRGNCPAGEMEYRVISANLAGYEGHKTIQISYHIPSGTQGPEHPHPGKRYSTRGFPRVGYVPDCDKGRKVLQLLIVAWKRRLTFTIGTSATTGEDDTVIWNEIHHKTELGTNYSGHGYPDPKYLDNVLLELAVHGITEKDLPP